MLLTHVTSVTWDHYNRANDNENANESARALIWICVSAISLNNNRRITITRDLRDLTGRRTAGVASATPIGLIVRSEFKNGCLKGSWRSRVLCRVGDFDWGCA